MKMAIITAKEIEAFSKGEATREQAKKMDQAIQKWFDKFWEPMRKDLIAEFMKLVDDDVEVTDISYEVLYAAVGRMMDGCMRNMDEITEKLDEIMYED